MAHVVVTSKISKLVVALGQDSGATVCLISLRFPMNGVAVGISSVVAAAAAAYSLCSDLPNSTRKFVAVVVYCSSGDFLVRKSSNLDC